MDQFRALIWEFSGRHRRVFEWRRDPTPYGVFVSEVMLQQTQVGRVERAYPAFMRRFDGFASLVQASAADVLAEWQGMGYNRRALWLKSAARKIVEQHGGVLPKDAAFLRALPGIGPNTAGSIAAFAFDLPAVFIETNIRRVFIYHFRELQAAHLRSNQMSGVKPDGTSQAANDPAGIGDAMLLPLIEATLDRGRPREWYYGLMDFGADLAKRVPNPNRASKHYDKQPRFAGSRRQLRGEVLRQLLAGSKTALELVFKTRD